MNIMVRFLKELRKVQKLIEDIVNDDEFQGVIKSNNTDSNKRINLKIIYENKNIKTLIQTINSTSFLKRRCERKNDTNVYIKTRTIESIKGIITIRPH